MKSVVNKRWFPVALFSFGALVMILTIVIAGSMPLPSWLHLSTTIAFAIGIIMVVIGFLRMFPGLIVEASGVRIGR